MIVSILGDQVNGFNLKKNKWSHVNYNLPFKISVSLIACWGGYTKLGLGIIYSRVYIVSVLGRLGHLLDLSRSLIKI